MKIHVDSLTNNRLAKIYHIVKNCDFWSHFKAFKYFNVLDKTTILYFYLV